MLKKTAPGTKWPLFILLLIAALILSFNINKPFWGHHDWNGVYWGQVAKNFAQDGPLKTQFAMILNAGPAPVSQYNYNFHFTPFFTLIWAAFFKVFGVANWVSRLFAITFSLGGLVVFFKLVEKHFNSKVAVISTFFYLSTPMFIYFGKMPVHEIPLMFFVLSAIYFYLAKDWPKFYFFTVLAMFTTWPGFFLIPVITLFEIKNLRKLILFWLTAVLIFCLFLVHNHYVTGDFLGGGLREVLLLRTGGVNLVWYLGTLARWAWTYCFLLVPLSITGFLLTRNKILAIFFTYATIYPIIFRDAASRHDYLLIYFWPFLALASALTLTTLLHNNVVKLAVATATIILLTVYFRWNFVVALQESSLYRESVRVGEYAGPRTSPGDKILIISKDRSVPFDGWFSSYYANRPVSFDYVDEFPQTEDPGYRVFYFFPGGKIQTGMEIKSMGIK